MDPVEDALFTRQFQKLLEQESKQKGPTEAQRFWLAYWAGADASRAYRRRAHEWRDAGFADWADELDSLADDNDARWDAKLKARHS